LQGLVEKRTGIHVLFVGGTRLTLWHNIDRRFISWGTAGWHICFDVLERLLAGKPIGPSSALRP
jgi:hypothetical protein